MSAPAVLQGGCFCGFVRYRVDARPTNETNCHCSMCRGVHGAAFVTWFSVPPAAFAWVAGTPTRFASSDHATRSFCPRCGTPLAFESRQTPDEIDVVTCTLDHPDAAPPRDETHVHSRVGWVRLDDRLPAYPGARPPQR